MRKIKAEDIIDEEHAKLILDVFKTHNEYLDTISDKSNEYENICEDIQEQFCEIYDALNVSKMKFTNHNIYITEIMNFSMWDYLKDKITFNELLQKLNDVYSKRD